MAVMEPQSDDGSGSEAENLGDMFASNTLNNNSKRHCQSDEKKLSQPSKKKRRLRKEDALAKLQKPPTVDELNRLRETENLFHSNLFRRQIEEMLKELDIKSKTKVRINIWFDKFKDWLGKMENSDESHSLQDFNWLKTLNIIFPLSHLLKHTSKGNYRFKKPSSIKIAGSYAAGTFLNTGSIDLNVTVPSSFFDKEDYLNGRYFIKRAIYLCEIAKHLQLMTDLVADMKFCHHDGDDWSPRLRVTPSVKLKNIYFLLHVVPEESCFRLSRFIPTRNNVRSRWLLESQSDITDSSCPTPIYNSGVLRDLRSDANNAYLVNLMSSNDQLRGAVVLLKVWAKQRELQIGHASFTGHLIMHLVAYLLSIRKINSTMSSYQVIRTVWNYLSVADWGEHGITLCASSSQHEPSMVDFHNQFSLVFVDSSGFLNLCSGMCPTLFRRCRDEAALAVQSLDTPGIDSFQVLFMLPAPFSQLCDHSIVFHNWSSLERLVQEHSGIEKKINNCGVVYPQARDLLVSLLRKALGQRVKRIFAASNDLKYWPIDKKPKTATDFSVGLILNAEYCFNLVDKGPAADAKEAEEFRKFWAERSELRRFKDGSILESVLWKGQTWSEKRMICRQVTQYILAAKFGLTDSHYRYIGDELEAVLNTERESQTVLVHTAFDSLAKHLRSLKDLPLDVISTQGASPVFRWSDLYPPELHASRQGSQQKSKTVGNCRLVDPNLYTAPPWCSPAEVVLQLGSSNKWPKDLEAVRRIRAAFNIKIAQLLKEKCGYVTHAFLDWVDVLTDTCVFRLRIVYPAEIGLMKKTISSDGVVMYRDNRESLHLEKIAVQIPKLTSQLNGLQSQFSSYGSACCLAKRWVRSHMFQEAHLSDEAIDLLVAAVYVNPEPWQPPNQPQVAFLRFISLLANTDWNIECIILNFNQTLTQDEKRGIESRFTSMRATLPCLFIATPDVSERSVWTQDGPSPVVLHRLATLANLTLALLQPRLMAKWESSQVQMLFKPTLDAFDVLIHLVKGSVPKLAQSLNAKKAEKRNNGENQSSIIPVIGYNPPELYLTELEEGYGECALFFYDPYGGDTIGVLWKPDIKVPREFKVSNCNGRSLDKQTNKLHFNFDSVLQSFYIIGKGLVKTIKVKEGNVFVNVTGKI